MRVEKWQALGNHFVVLRREVLPWPLTAARTRLLCDAALGLGGDGVLEIAMGETVTDGGDVEVVVRNRDGGVAEVSGNGTRIAVAVAVEAIGRDDLAVRTGAGAGRGRRLDDGRFAVAIGRAVLEGPQYAPDGDPPGVDHRFVSIGNPHCVVWVSDADGFSLAVEGPRLEHHHWFPEGVNVEAVQVIDRRRLALRVWERGVGETQACGSGAVAAGVAAVVEGRCQAPVTVAMPGGEVEVAIDDALDVTLIGAAERVYAAELDMAFLGRLERAR